MKTKIIALALISSFALTGCMSNGDNQWRMGTKQTIGGGAGAILGGVVGSNMGKGKGQLWATGAGALLGAFVGSEIGKSLDQADMAYHQQAIEQAYAAPLNEEISWNNMDSGHSGSVTPIREGRQTSTNNICRQYKQTIFVEGNSETATGTACQNDDGTWTVVR